MQPTLLTALLLAALASLSHAEELKASDVPTACNTICGPMVTLTNTCDVDPHRLRRRDDHDDDKEADDAAEEAVEAQCICSNTSFNVRSIAALCAACIAQNGRTTNDMNRIMSQCGFASTTFVPGATTAVASVTVQATKPAFAQGSGGGSGASSASTGSRSGTSAGGISAGAMSRDMVGTKIRLALAGTVVAVSILLF